MSSRFQKFRDMSLKKKLVLLYISVFLLPLSVLSFYTYEKTRQEYAENLRYSSAKNFEQTISYLSFRFDRIARMFTNMQLNESINNILCSSPLQPEIRQQISNLTALRTYLSSITDEQESIRPKLYIKNNAFYRNEGNILFSMEDYVGERWMKESLKGWGWLTFCPPDYMGDESIMAMVRPLRNLQNYKDIVAVVRVDIPLAEIRDMIQRASPTPDSLTYIESLDGEFLLSSDQALEKRFHIPIEKITGAIGNEEQVQRLAADYDLACFESHLIPKSNWIIVSLTRNLSLNNRLMDTLKNLLLIFITVLLVGFLLSFPIVNTITKGILAINRRMKRFQSGDFSTRFTPNSHDEIGNMMYSFNMMLDRIEALAAEQYALGKDLQTAEMMALQSQINPHFLYNTLDLINWMIVGKRENEAKKIVLALARFYRLSLSRGKDIITIGEEVEMLRHYALIQQTRFRDSIRLEFDMNEVLDYLIPKITLQPIVENAIIHGIMEKPSKSGFVKLSGRLEGDTVVIHIEDDGVGGNVERLYSLVDGQAVAPNRLSSGYGLYNINRRLCLYFGIQRGMDFDSVPSGGTRVRIRIPAVTSSEKICGSLGPQTVQ